MCKVSVIIPTYNRGKLLVEAVNSLRNQTFTDFEIIIVDDGSTDHTKEVVDDAINKNPELKIIYVYQENSGPSVARNKGIDISNGEYITFLDSDDIYLPDKLEVQFNAFLDFPDYAMCFTNYLAMDDLGNILVDKSQPDILLSGKIYPELLFFKGTTITCPSVMVKAEIIRKEGGFDTSMHICEDLDLWRRIAKNNLVLQIKSAHVAIRYRLNERINIRSFIKARDVYYKKAFNGDPGFDLEIKRNLYKEMYREYGYFALRKEEKILGVYLLYQCFLLDPLELLKQVKNKVIYYVVGKIKRYFFRR